MKYFIIESGKPKEVSHQEYAQWDETHSTIYTLPAYSKQINGDVYSIETAYKGEFEEDQDVSPFVLFYFVDVPKIKTEGLEFDLTKNKVEFFKSYRELLNRYNQLIDELECKNDD